MKKLIYISALCLTMALAACAPSEIDDIFDDSPAVRLDNAIKTYTEYFQSNGGRWLMQYFATDGEEGYNFIMTFHNDGSVEISAQNDYVNDGAFTTDVSLWEVIADYGPVLSFNTYNKAFHVFTSPEDIPGTSADEQGKGHEGDYEFIIMKAEDNQAVVRGKKRGINMIMTRLSTTEYPTDEDYFNALAARRKAAFSERVGNYILTTPSGRQYVCNDPTTMYWSFYPIESSLLDNGDYMTAIITTTGVRFIYPLDFITEYNPEDPAPQNFEFQPDGTLLCTDDGATTITGPDLPDLFMQTQLAWTVDKEAMGGDFVTAYADIVDKAKSLYRQTFNWIQLKYNTSTKKYCLYFRNGRYYGTIYLTPQKVDANTIRFTFDPNAEGAMDANAKAHYDRIEGLQQFVTLLTSSDFTMSAENHMVSNPVVLTSKSNSANYITIGF